MEAGKIPWASISKPAPMVETVTSFATGATPTVETEIVSFLLTPETTTPLNLIAAIGFIVDVPVTVSPGVLLLHDEKIKVQHTSTVTSDSKLIAGRGIVIKNSVSANNSKF
jgi:hypothetical protein